MFLLSSSQGSVFFIVSLTPISLYCASPIERDLISPAAWRLYVAHLTRMKDLETRYHMSQFVDVITQHPDFKARLPQKPTVPVNLPAR